MNYAVILSGGIGSRVENIDLPKQYYTVNDIPIIIYTLKTFIDVNCFDYIYVPIDDKYKTNRCGYRDYMRKYEKYQNNYKNFLRKRH